MVRYVPTLRRTGGRCLKDCWIFLCGNRAFSCRELPFSSPGGVRRWTTCRAVIGACAAWRGRTPQAGLHRRQLRANAHDPRIRARRSDLGRPRGCAYGEATSIRWSVRLGSDKPMSLMGGHYWAIYEYTP